MQLCNYCATFGRIGNRLVYREECDYCATFGRIDNRLPYRKVCDYSAAFGSVGNDTSSKLGISSFQPKIPYHTKLFCQLRDANKTTNHGTT